MRFLVLIVLALFAAFVSALPVPQEDYNISGEQAVIDAINGMRSERGLTPLVVSQCLNSIAASNNQQFGKTIYGNTDLSVDFQPYTPDGNACSASLNNIMKFQMPALVSESAFVDSLKRMGTINSLMESKATNIGINVSDPASSTRYWTVLYSS
ncbi:hypothetical protein BDF22DRAFT_707166 [Syncephalis plumigaleata]|nr:hypothetical protein BDF22DRAFT_707166 [Syncephalis plumigaleata]